MKKEYEVHHGENVRKLRELIGPHKQEWLAEQLDISQATMSRLENQSHIDDEMLARIAVVMGIPVDTIKNFDRDSAVKVFSNSFHDESIGCKYNQCTINPLDKVVEMYERMIREKEEAMREKQSCTSVCCAKKT